MIHSKIPPHLPFSKGETHRRDDNRQSRKRESYASQRFAPDGWVSMPACAGMTEVVTGHIIREIRQNLA